MATIIIFAVIGIIVAIYLTYKDKFLYDIVFAYIANSIIGVAAGVLLGMTISFSLPMKLYDQKTTFKIETLQDNLTVKGSLTIGCGTINGEMNYFFYVKTGETYKLYQIKSNCVLIKYANEPKVIVIKPTPTKDLINLFALDNEISRTYYILEVPKGTIKNNYNLDAQ